jgi:hypothetical protein
MTVKDQKYAIKERKPQLKDWKKKGKYVKIKTPV